jgi:hypothetical protein
VQKTERDDLMLGWLSVVRTADLDAVRYALAGLANAPSPVSLRKAQQWTARMVEAGLVGRFRATYRDSSIVWATFAAVGKPAPNLHRQTVRHEVAVAAVSARYLFRGFGWERDRKPIGMLDHQADGIATKGEVVELIEVELTPKTVHRYKLICQNHASRLTHEGIARIGYFCTADAARTVSREADKLLFRELRPLLVAMHIFDGGGRWVGDDRNYWADGPGSAVGRPAEPNALLPVDSLLPFEALLPVDALLPLKVVSQ